VDNTVGNFLDYMTKHDLCLRRPKHIRKMQEKIQQRKFLDYEIIYKKFAFSVPGKDDGPHMSDLYGLDVVEAEAEAKSTSAGRQ